jgi:hypothetical protein
MCVCVYIYIWHLVRLSKKNVFCSVILGRCHVALTSQIILIFFDPLEKNEARQEWLE